MFDGASRSGFTYQRETFAQAIAGDGEALLGQQFAEAGEREAGPFSLDRPTYETMDKAGRLRIFTVRNGDVIAGYMTYFVFSGMHAKTTVCAISDAWWVRPEFRRPTIAMRLIQFAESELRRDGVRVMHTHSNPNFPGGERLLEHLGHPVVSKTHAKVLTDG